MKGKGQSWSRAMIGCDLRFYGWDTDDEHNAARVSAELVKSSVLAAVPVAEVQIRDIDDPHFGVRVHVRVDADALAVFKNGPLHRKAIAKANIAASRAMDDGPYCRVRLRE